MNVTFEGAAYPQDFILTDTQMDCGLEGAHQTFQMMLGDGMVTILPIGGGKVRVVASGVTQQGSAEAERVPTLQDFDEAIAKMVPAQDAFPKPRLYDPVWLARFHLHHRCVNKYRDGRLFLAEGIHRRDSSSFGAVAQGEAQMC